MKEISSIRSYDILHFQRFGRDLALLDEWFQTISRKMGSDNNIKLKFSTNVSNRYILKVVKFLSLDQNGLFKVSIWDDFFQSKFGRNLDMAPYVACISTFKSDQ